MKFYDFVKFDVVNVEKNEDNLEYKFVLPGVDKQNIHITVTNNQLTVETKEKTFYGQKFKYVDYYNYDANYSIEQTTAKLQNGVLTINMPKKKGKNKVKQITID